MSVVSNGTGRQVGNAPLRTCMLTDTLRSFFQLAGGGGAGERETRVPRRILVRPMCPCNGMGPASSSSSSSSSYLYCILHLYICIYMYATYIKLHTYIHTFRHDACLVLPPMYITYYTYVCRYVCIFIRMRIDTRSADIDPHSLWRRG